MPSPGGEIISCEQREKKHPSEVPSVGTWMKVFKLSPVRTLRPPRSQIGSTMDGPWQGEPPLQRPPRVAPRNGKERKIVKTLDTAKSNKGGDAANDDDV